MSQTILPQSSLPQSSQQQPSEAAPPVGPAASNEFNYRPIPILAPLSACLGLMSGLAFIGIFALPIGVLGMLLAVICIVKLKRSRGEYGGMWLATLGLLMSIVFTTSGAALWAHTYRTEVPEGFQRINFNDDISKKGFIADKNSKEFFHPEVKSLDGKLVFLKGYIYPTKEYEGLKSFLLVKDTGQCCFGGNPAITDMIMVELKDGKTVDYHDGLMSVAGVFRCKPAVGPERLMPVYTLEGTFVERARTSF